MINVTNNPFSSSGFQSGRPIADSVALRNCASRPPASLVASWNNQDEYIPSSSSPSSGTYTRSSISVVPLANGETAISVDPLARGETVRTGEITDKMREEMRNEDGSYWSAMSLISVAYPTLSGIIDQVFEEKGINETIFYEGCSYGMSINPDGVFIFPPEEFSVKGVDEEFAEEICLALEDAVNSSALNMKDNPQLFQKNGLSPDYEPAKWGRDIDRDEWLSQSIPDYSEYIEELRADICDKYSDLNVVDFSMKITDEGKLTIFNVKTEGNDPIANAQALERMNNGLTGEIEKKAEYLGLLLFSVRGYTHGDVLMEGMLEPFDDGSRGDIKRYKQEIILTSGTDYKFARTAEQPKSARRTILPKDALSGEFR